MSTIHGPMQDKYWLMHLKNWKLLMQQIKMQLLFRMHKQLSIILTLMVLLPNQQQMQQRKIQIIMSQPQKPNQQYQQSLQRLKSNKKKRNIKTRLIIHKMRTTPRMMLEKQRSIMLRKPRNRESTTNTKDTLAKNKEFLTKPKELSMLGQEPQSKKTMTISGVSCMVNTKELNSSSMKLKHNSISSREISKDTLMR